MAQASARAWPPAYLSVSAVECFEKCPALYARRYREGIKDPPNPAMVFGTAFHAGVEAIHKGENGNIAYFQAYCEQEALMHSLGQLMIVPPAYGFKLLDEYRRRPGGPLTGLPERKFRLHLPGRVLSVPIFGFIDLAGPAGVGEFKTTRSNRWWTQKKVDSSYQAAVYAWAYTQLFKQPCAEVRYFIFSTVYAGPAKEFVAQLPADPLAPFIAACQKVWLAIEKNAFPATCGGKCDLHKAGGLAA